MSEETQVPENLDSQPNLQEGSPAPAENQSEGQLDNQSNSELTGQQEKGSYNQSIPYGRFQEVNQQKNEFKSNAEKFQAENEQLKQALQSLTGGVKPEEPQESRSEQPNLNKEQLVEALQEIRAQEQQQENQAKITQNWTKQLGDAKQKYADFDDALAKTTTQLPPEHIEKAIMANPKGGDLYYALAKNPEQANVIFNMQPYEALTALGEFAAKLPGTTGQPIKSSGMPNPIDPVGSSKVNTPSGAVDYNSISQEDYDAMHPPIW